MFWVISGNYQTDTSLNEGKFICTTPGIGWNPLRNVCVYINMKRKTVMVKFLNAMRT